jgi:fatty-acyl-CoA synthase
MTGLLAWLESPRADVGVRIANHSGWEYHPYTDIASRVQAVASRLVQADAIKGRVCILLPNSVDFIAAFFGALGAGATPSPLPPPFAFQELAPHVSHLASMLQIAQPAAVCTNASYQSITEQALEQAGHRAEIIDVQAASREELGSGRRPEPSELGLLQFTSGSTGTPRGVALRLEQVESNIRAIESWLGMTPDSNTATWLPFSHDMGLIGTLLTPIVTQTALSVLPPEQFIINPLRWLECFGKSGSDICTSPTFGLGLIARRVHPDVLDGFDFSRWRVLIVGAERVRPDVLENFTRLLEPYGFSRRVFRPAYGLAESTLATTGHDGESCAKVIKVDWSSLRDSEPVRIEAQRPLGPLDAADASNWLISCGRPLSGMEVEIFEPGGTKPLPEGHLGEIVVGGRSLAQAYWTAERHDESPFHGRSFATGDLGFIRDGELFVVGRIGDRLKVRARHVYSEDLEVRLVTETSLREGRVAVLMGAWNGVDTAVVVVEQDRGKWEEEVLHAMRQATGEELQIRILAGPRGTIDRTTSGKPRRRVMWAKLTGDGLPPTVVVREWSPS